LIVYVEYKLSQKGLYIRYEILSSKLNILIGVGGVTKELLENRKDEVKRKCYF